MGPSHSKVPPINDISWWWWKFLCFSQGLRKKYRHFLKSLWKVSQGVLESFLKSRKSVMSLSEGDLVQIFNIFSKFWQISKKRAHKNISKNAIRTSHGKRYTCKSFLNGQFFTKTLCSSFFIIHAPLEWSVQSDSHYCLWSKTVPCCGYLNWEIIDIGIEKMLANAE